jgi:hypothetical protein
MGNILHGWDLAQKKVLLGKIFTALPKGVATSYMNRLSTMTAETMRSVF